jgi:hypothetical protein
VLVHLTYRVMSTQTVLFAEDVEVNTPALRGRTEVEIEFIISQYISDWAARHEWYNPSVHSVAWLSIDQKGNGLSFVPSEPRDDGY